jgi:hypothetical protein
MPNKFAPAVLHNIFANNITAANMHNIIAPDILHHTAAPQYTAINLVSPVLLRNISTPTFSWRQHA